MAIDPSISLSYRPPQLNLQSFDPLLRRQKLLTIQGLMEQGDMRRLQMEQQQMQLEQMRRETQERQEYNKWIAQIYGAPGAPTVQPTPIGGTVAQTAPAIVPPSRPPTLLPAAPPQPILPPATGPMESVTVAPDSDFGTPPATIAPNFGLPAPPRTIGNLMTGPAPQAPAAALPATGAPRFNLGEMVTRFPNIGPAMAKNLAEFEKSQYEMQLKQHEATVKNAERWGSLANSILLAKDPAAAYKPVIWQAIREGTLTGEQGRTLLDHPFNADEIKLFVDQAQNLKDQAETNRTNLLSSQEAQKKAALDIRLINNQEDYTNKFLPTLPPDIRAFVGPTFSPALKAVIANWDVSGAQLPDAFTKQLMADAQILAPARGRGDAAYSAALANLPPARRSVFEDAKTPEEVINRALTPEQATTAAHNKRVEELTKEGQDATRAQQIATREGELRDDFTRASEKFVIARDAYGLTQMLKASPVGGVRDIALIYNWMRMIDPGSHVTGSEEANASNAGGVAESIRNLYNRLLKGEKLSDETFNQITEQIESTYQQKLKDHQKLFDQYKATAERQHVDWRNALPDFTSTAGKQNQPEKPQYQTIERTGGTPGGRVTGTITIAPTGKAQQAVPPAVKEALAGAERGKIHQLSDGSVWLVNADGSIQPTTAPRQ